MGIASYIFLLASVLFALLILWASRKPEIFHVERKEFISATPTSIFKYINDISLWPHWSPWSNKDSNVKITYSIKTSGSGASVSWDGDNRVGKGRLTILATVPPTNLFYRLDFERPLKDMHLGEFTMEVVPNGTEITWSLRGAHPLFSRVICFFYNLEKVIGRDMDVGLKKLKTLLEKDIIESSSPQILISSEDKNSE